MIDPLGLVCVPTIIPGAAAAHSGAVARSKIGGVGGAGVAGADFATAFREQLEQVSAMQNEADRKVQDVVTGKSDNIGDVFVAARKAEFAFSLLMEIRNKLVDSYEELRQLRV